MSKNKGLGITFAMAAAFIYGFTPILGKLTYAEGSNSLTLALFRSVFAIPVLFAILKAKKITCRVTKREFGILCIMGILASALTALLLYASYNYISVGLTTSIHFVYPVIVALVCVLCFKDKISKTKVLAIVLSVTGLLLFLEKDLDINMIGVAFAFLSGITYAAYVIVMDKSGIGHLHPFLITFYCCCAAATLMFLYGTANGGIAYDMSFKGWILTFIVSMFVSVIANSMIPVAVKIIGGTTTSILGMLEPIASVVLGILFLSETCTLRGVIGCGLVITSVVLLTMEGAKEGRKETAEGSKIQ